MASTARIDELKKKFDENPRRYFAPLANEFRKSGDIEQAIVICEEFLPQQPGHMSGHIVYGQALYEAGRMPESRTVFETALGLDPENLIALRHLGDIAHAQADVVAARSWYLRVLDADPRNEEIQALIASMPADTSAPAEAIQIIAEDDFDLASPMSATTMEATSVGVPMDIEKEEPSLEATEPELGDTHPLGIPVIPSVPTPPPLPTTELIDGFSLHGFEASPERTGIVEAPAPADGLESTSFTPPEHDIAGADDLDDSLDSGVPSFQAPTQVIAAIDGLQGSGGSVHPQYSEDVDTEEFAAAERPVLDDGSVLPPQGDPLAASAYVHAEPAADTAPSDSRLLDFDMERADAIVEPEPIEAAAGDVPSNDMAPMEISASVLAAESKLIDAGETPAPEPALETDIVPALEEEFKPVMEMVTEGEAPAVSEPFVTETMAELYVAQGLHEQARSVYARLLAANPGDVRLQGLVASLTSEHREHDTAPTVREFLARMAARRPRGRTAAATPPADDDFADVPTFSEPLAAPLAEDVAADAPDGIPEIAPFAEAEASEPEVMPEDFGEPHAEPPMSSSDVAPAIERAAAMRTPTGSIDALFNHRSPGTSADSAASALAQAFGATAEAEPLIVGRPARAASAELSLDSVFRDGPSRPPRTSQSFSFDQFFTAGASNAGTADRPANSPRASGEVAMPGEPPAERSADDIQQFNSWLQGLKPR
ncbi:MAG: tetratricopeptide repeat protein [Gemmatimonadaceae bacterium]